MTTRNLSPAEVTVLAFGGTRKLARALGIDPSAVSRWKQRGRVPTGWQAKLLHLAGQRGLDLTAQDIIGGRQVQEETA